MESQRGGGGGSGNGDGDSTGFSRDVAAEVPKIAGVGMLQQRQWRRHRKERRMRQQECEQLQE